MVSGADSRIDAFFEFLAERQAAPQPVIAKARTFFHAPGDIRIGQIAVLKGFLAPRDVVVIIALQTDCDLKFGEIAVARGLMTQEQVDAALANQADRSLQVLELIKLNWALSDETCRTLLEDFGPWLKQNHGPLLLRDQDFRLVRAKDAERIRAALKQVRKLASLPTVVQRALALLEDPDVRLDKVGKVLEGDPPIAAQVLRLSNSAAFGLRNKVTTLVRAMVVLGMTNVRQVVLAATIMTQFKGGNREATKAFWFRCIFAGQWARALAARPNSAVPPEEAFIGGLMADLGQIAIEQHFAKAHLEIKAKVNKGVPLFYAEREALGLTHPDVGAYIAHCWNFPPMLEEAILYHHTPSSAVRRLNLHPGTKLVNAACRLSELSPGADLVGGIALLDSDFLDCHELGRATPLALAPQVLEETKLLTARLIL